MQSLHFPHTSSRQTENALVSPSNAALKWLSLSELHLAENDEPFQLGTGDSEYVIAILSGTCTVHVMSPKGAKTWEEIGGRDSVFGGAPTMCYIPREAQVRISADSPKFEAVLISAPSRQDFSPAAVFPDEVQARSIGGDNWQRTVYTAIGENVEADRLIIGETVNPPGNWSSAPPHKHDTPGEQEAVMEEVYHYRLNPPQGFGLQRIYTAPGDAEPMDVTYAVRNGDTIAIPRGYHPVVAAPGYQLYYLWALAGDERRYGAWSDDPEHAWIKGVS